MVDISKRHFLRLSEEPENLSPLPWLITPEKFKKTCTQCGNCVSACETKIITPGLDGYPGIDFKKGECTFCYACANACEEDLFLSKSEKPWLLSATISEKCLAKNNVECRTCSETCEPFAINFQLQIGMVGQPVINIENCTGCGACVSICPVSAISISA